MRIVALALALLALGGAAAVVVGLLESPAYRVPEAHLHAAE